MGAFSVARDMLVNSPGVPAVDIVLGTADEATVVWLELMIVGWGCNLVVQCLASMHQELYL